MFTEILDAVWAEQSIAPFKASFDAFLAANSAVVPYVFMAICLIIGLFGRRLTGVIRVCLLFAIGFVASVYWIVPFVNTYVPAIPGYVVGLVIGVIAACLSNFIYNAAYIGAIGFGIFNMCYSGTILVELTAFTKDNWIASLIAAIVVVIIALIIRKYLEMLITAAIGGIDFASTLTGVFNYTVYVTFLSPVTTSLFAGIILAVIFFIIQYRNRIRY